MRIVMATASWLMTVFTLSTAQAGTEQSPAVVQYGDSICGHVCDGTPDYSEWRFKRLERVMANFNPNTDGADEEKNRAFLAALRPLVETSKPLPNVTVTLRAKSTVSGAHEFLLKTVTDSRGKFIFSGVPRGEYSVTAQVRQGWWTPLTGEAQKQVEHYRSSDTVNLVFYSQPAIIRGRITDRAGRPIASAKVTATDYRYLQETSQEGAVRSHVVSALTAGDGAYELARLMPGNIYFGPKTYDVRVEKEGYTTAEMSVPVATEEVFSAHKRLMRILLENSGQEGKVGLAEWERESQSQPSRKGRVVTGINLVMGIPSILTGRVIDPQEKPQAGCEIWLDPVRKRWAPLVQDAPTPEHIQTDAQGAFECRGVPAGHYKILVGKDSRWANAGSTNFMIGEAQVITGMTLEIDLQPLGQIEATVRKMDDGTPVTNFSAYVSQVVNSNEYWSATGILKLNSTGCGTFSVEKISPGKATLEVTAPGFAPEHPTIDVPPGQTVSLIAKMMRSGAVTTRVIRDGAPLQHSENLQAFSEETGVVTYGRNGMHEIPGLKPGRYKIRAHIFEGQKCIRYEVAPIIIDADKTNTVTFDFSGSSSLAISLALPPNLAARLWVEAAEAPADQPFEKNLGMVAYLWQKWPGTFEVKHLRPGAYRVYAQLIDPVKGNAAKTESLPRQCQMVTLKEGNATTLDFHF